MTDIFDTKIVCRHCNLEMKQAVIHKQGASVRAVVCENCGDKIIHPEDLNALEHFSQLRSKTFTVKLRVVGNSHAVSIPKEIIDFINEQHRQNQSQMDDMVRLCFEDFDKLSMRFGNEDEQ